jgi:uncharacterized protein YggE
MFMRILVLGLLCTPVAGIASPLPDYPFVFTAGSAERHLVPDVGNLGFTIRSHQREVDRAISTVESASKRVATLLQAAGVKLEDIDASSIDKSEKEHWEPGMRQSVSDGHEASRRFEVAIRDLSKYPTLVKGVFELPESDDFSASFGRSDREQIQGELFDQAAKDAQTRAQRMATSFGRKLGQVRGIAQVPFTSLAHWLGFPDAAYYPAPAISLPDFASSLDRLLVPATISITVEVNAVFEIQ